MVALRTALAVMLLSAIGCSSAAKPIDVRPGDTCAHCRMAVSDPRFAGQIAAPGEEPLFFDDIGCMAKAFVAAGGTDSRHLFVADHRTGEWVRAESAVYTRVPGLETPMGSHLIAHAGADSARADAASVKGERLSFADVVGAASGERRAPGDEAGSANGR